MIRPLVMDNQAQPTRCRGSALRDGLAIAAHAALQGTGSILARSVVSLGSSVIGRDTETLASDAQANLIRVGAGPENAE